MYEFEEYYEPSVYDEIMTETIQRLKDATKLSISSYYKGIEDYNKRVVEENNDLRKKIRDIEYREEQLKNKEINLMKNIKQKRLSEILEELNVFLYRAYPNRKDLPKCNKCNKDKKIEFKLPSGKTSYENCECSEGYCEYEPQEYELTEFSQDTRGFRNSKINKWYKFNENKDAGYYSSSSVYVEKIYTDDMSFKNLDVYHLYFRDKEDCQKYCDYLNKQK